MLSIIFVTSFATVCLMVIGLTMKGERALLDERMRSLGLSATQDLTPELTQPLGDRVVRPAVDKIASLFGRFVPATATATTAARIERAGSPGSLRPIDFMLLKAVSILVFAGAGVAVLVLYDASVGLRVAAMLVGVVIGIALPDAMLERAIQARHAAMRRALSDCLDLLVVSTEAGLAFDSALKKVVERVRGPLADEFRRVLDDMSIGRTRAEALKAMSDRVALAELTTFVAAIRWADLLGTSMAEVLRIQSENLRTHRHLRAREATAKLPLKLLFPLVFCIFPSIFIVILVPGALQLFHALSGTGR